MLLDQLPPEIMDQIVEGACTDGGKTGCALSGVSRTIRDASAPMRYYSVALRGARQIRAFLSLLEHRGIIGFLPKSEGRKDKNHVKRKDPKQWLPDSMVNVRHLFLVDYRSSASTFTEALAEWPALPDAGRLSTSVHRHEVDCGFRRRFLDREAMKAMDAAYAQADFAVKDLLVRLAPTLKYLCINQKMKSSLLHSRVPLPALVELTCRLEASHLLSKPKPTFLRTQFPVLERLHYISEPIRRHAFSLAETRDLPPSLSLVRFSDMQTPSELASIMCHRPWAEQDLLSILVSLGPMTLEPSEWRKVASVNKKVTQKMIVVEDLNAYDSHRLHKEWLERVGGGNGCWKEGKSLSLTCSQW
jgi:hypothetical protein